MAHLVGSLPEEYTRKVNTVVEVDKCRQSRDCFPNDNWALSVVNHYGSLVWYKARITGHPVRIKLINNGFLVSLAKFYTT